MEGSLPPGFASTFPDIRGYFSWRETVTAAVFGKLSVRHPVVSAPGLPRPGIVRRMPRGLLASPHGGMALSWSVDPPWTMLVLGCGVFSIMEG